MILLLKYPSWIITVAVRFAGSWLFEFTVTDASSKRKRLTRSGKVAASIALVGLLSALFWTILDDRERRSEKLTLAEYQDASERRQLELQKSQAAVQDGQLAIARKQDDLSAAVRLVTFLVRDRAGTATEDGRRAYGQSLQAVSHLLSEAEHESLRDLLELPAQEIPRRLEELPRQWVDLIVSNSPACLQLLERTNFGDAGRRVLVPLSESVGLAVVISVLGSKTLNFRPMQPANEFDLSAGFQLELENGRAVRIDWEMSRWARLRREHYDDVARALGKRLHDRVGSSRSSPGSESSET